MENGDILRTLPVERLGRSWGWRLEREENVPRVADALLHGRPVAVFQDAGRREWWKSFGPWPHSCERLDAWPTAANWDALLVISDRILSPPPPELESRMVVYRPASLTVGIACCRGVELEELEASLGTLFEEHRLSRLSVTAVAASAGRKHEPSLVAFAEDHAVPFLAYARDKLLIAHEACGAKSERLRSAATCEPAALLSAGAKDLVVRKTLFRRLALAVARRPFA
jgi:cobalt-precorrin 5A hydrolase